MSDMLGVLPPRPLYARPPLRLVNRALGALTLLMFAGILVFSLAVIAPVLVTDWRVRDTAVQIDGAHLTDGRCHSKLFIVDCDVTLSAPAGRGAVVTRGVHYDFASFNGGDYTARVVGDPRRPEWLTTDLALERFWNRALTLLVECGFLAAIVLASVAGLVKAWRNRVPWRRIPAVPVALQLVSVQRDQYSAVWTVRAEDGQTAKWTFPRRAKPFVLGPANRVLGLAVRDGAAVMPLDAGLRWVNLTRVERRAALATHPSS